jgi:hypothetical protein
VATLELSWLRARPAPLRAALVAAAMAAAVTAVYVLPLARLAHRSTGNFADGRTILGIPNGLDVLSNLPFALVGLLGFVRLPRVVPELRREACTLYVALIAVLAGSSFYHLAPSAGRLLFDRLPITVAFMSVFALVLGDRVSPRLAHRLHPVLLLAAAGAALHWYFGGDSPGGGDLRPYALVQAVPLVALPALLVFFPGRLDERRLALAVLFYGSAKLCELGDAWIWEQGGFVSGHTLKHLLAGVACFFLLPGPRGRTAS